MDKKAEFLKIWTDRVNREYADNLLGWLGMRRTSLRPRLPPGTTAPTRAACWNIP